MKNSTTLHDETNLSPSITADKSAARHIFKLGLDVDLNNVVTAIQCDHSEIKPAQKFSRARLIAWVKEKVAAGHSVHAVYECCGFGYTLHEQLLGAGATSIVTTPMRLSDARKNDRMDARQLCVRLSRYLDGHQRGPGPKGRLTQTPPHRDLKTVSPTKLILAAGWNAARRCSWCAVALAKADHPLDGARSIQSTLPRSDTTSWALRERCSNRS